MEHTNKVWIYALIDPRDETVKYIGKSKRPKARLREHIRRTYDSNSKKCAWIRKLLKVGLKPYIKILLETNEKEYAYWEEFYIKEHINKGCKLTNYDEKGIGIFSGKRQPIKKSTIRKLKKVKAKKIYQYDLNGNLIQEFPSLREAERILNINHGNISKCCNGLYPHTGGFIFKTDQSGIIQPVQNKKAEKKIVIEVSKDGSILQEFASIADAAKITGIDASNISRVCNGKKKDTYHRFFKFKEVINEQDRRN